MEWTEELLETRDLIDRKQRLSPKLQNPTVPPKLAMLHFNIGDPERTKEVHKHECNQLHTIDKEEKKQTSHLFQI